MKVITKTKTLLAYPPLTKFERYSSAIGASGGCQIPLGVFYLAAYIREHGYETDVIDAEAFDWSVEDIILRIQTEGFNVLGISATTVAFHRALELAKAVKNVLPETIIVLGGPHVSSQPTHPMKFDAFDFIVQGEGEKTLIELLQALENHSQFEKIKGLVFRNNNEIVVNEKRSYIEEVDSIPFPAYDLIQDMSKYIPPPSNYKRSPVANIITTRGCPNQCTFCDNNTFGRKMRLRGAKNVVAEIELLVNSFGVKEIAFVDDTFTLDQERIYEIFRQTRERGLRFPWTCAARIDTVNYDFLRYMKENGCWHISFGIESGNEKVLQTIRKKIKLDDVSRVINTCYRLGILTKGFFIIGHPTETLDTIDQTIELATKLRLDDIVVTINTPMPGSYQFEHAKEFGSLDTSNWSKFNYWNPVFVSDGLTHDILLAKHREIYRRFYLRPRILWRYFKSFFSRTGLKRLKSLLLASWFLVQKRSFVSD